MKTKTNLLCSLSKQFLRIVLLAWVAARSAGASLKPAHSLRQRTALLPRAMPALLLFTAGMLSTVAQELQLQTLYSFVFVVPPAHPRAGLVQGADGNFYGITSEGGAGGYGTVFRITTNGTLATLASFSGTSGASPNSLVQGMDGTFYGTHFLSY